jgi:predicted metal-binding membrane protein
MSITWMCVVAALILVKKLLPPQQFIDAPLALTIIALGILVVVTPSSIPGLTTTM